MIDTRNCKFCGSEFDKTPYDDGAKDEGYCHKLCRKDHERQLIKEGRIEGIPEFMSKLNLQLRPMVDTQYKDAIGEPIWFPKDGKPYHDKALGKTFKSKAEKSAYMKEKGFIMSGDDAPKRLPVEAGDMRNRSYRKSLRLED